MVLSDGIKAIGGLEGIGSLLGGIGSMFSFGGGTSLKKSKELARYNMDLNKEYTEWLNKNNYSFMREGLENADYNPMLALGASPQQGSVANSPASESMSFNPAGMAAMMNTVANTRLQEQQAETELTKRENLKADTGLKLVDKLYKEGLIKWQDRQMYADLVMKQTTSQLNTANSKSAIRNAATNARNAATNAFSANTARYRQSNRFFGFGSDSYVPPEYRSETKYYGINSDKLSEYGYY